MKRIARIAAKNRVLSGLLQSVFSGVLVLMLFNGAVSAHEFWMEPKDSTVEIGDPILGTLNVGQDLKGNTYSYLPPRFERFTVTTGDGIFDVQGRAGDNPALNMVAETNGLHIFAYQSKPERLTYSKREKFENFLKYEGLDWVMATHDARKLAPKGFRENYTRFAKALVQVGNPTRNDMDQVVGLPIELVALTNPMFSGDEQLNVQLLHEGKPLGDIQIAMFHRYLDSKFERTLFRTDEGGRATLALNGAGFYLLSAVQMIAINEDATGEDKRKLPAWHSLWASLSFHRE